MSRSVDVPTILDQQQNQLRKNIVGEIVNTEKHYIDVLDLVVRVIYRENSRKFRRKIMRKLGFCGAFVVS